MSPKRLIAQNLLIGALLIAGNLAQSAEPWADAKMPVQANIHIWLDATRQRQAARTHGIIHGGDGIGQELVYDASGHGRDLLQTDSKARPRYMRAGDLAFLRFDGENDFYRLEKQPGELKSFSIFAVAAPRRNSGNFQALLALNAAGKRDYESGLTIDQGPGPGPKFSLLNVEGRGFGGVGNLLKSAGSFGKLLTLEIRSDFDAEKVQLYVDGQLAGERKRAKEPISHDEFTLGARYYANDAEVQRVQGFGAWDVAELVIFSRSLSDVEAAKMVEYAATKYAYFRENTFPGDEGSGSTLVAVSDPPAVQMFRPGFTVRELPVELTNINNVKARPDGALVALGYDGNVWLVRDTNGDGLEDRADLFWDGKGTLRAPIGMDLTPPGYRLGNGLFVVSKGKCSLIVDTDGDDKADKEHVLAEGWTELQHGVDAVGVAFDKSDGSVYFGLGTAAYLNAYLVDKEGNPKYSLQDERGTILRVAPDFKSREIVCTGVRFPVGLAFNRSGDLFCTDQEGATWVPNGNPFDELLHLVKGRHYGFPARHPRHLPGVIDEPSVFDYGPQHQSTCGLNFNDPVRPGAPSFGPKDWAGDLFVTGYSRGKLYRTKLIKTDAGYVAGNELIASTKMLLADACVAGDGGLVLACHSGGPDWGSGPTGKGTLFKVSYSETDRPQPVFAWPASPGEIHVAFDRPVAAESLRDVARQARVTGGRFVRAGDRFEALWPGYAVVIAQKNTPRQEIPVRSAQLTPDRRTLILATDAHTASMHYAITLPGMGRPAIEGLPPGALPQHAQIDLDSDLSGCEVVWKPADGSSGWTGWLPHVDLQVARELTAGSERHDALWAALNRPGELTIKTQIDVVDMLRPAIQPGSRIDFEWPVEQTTLVLKSSGHVTLRGVGAAGVVRESDGGRTATLTVAPGRDRTVPAEIALVIEGKVPALTLTWHTNEDDRARTMALRRLLVPWAQPQSAAEAASLAWVRPAELEGGSWARGRKEFFGAQAGCSKCHTVHGQGAQVGPDLSNLIHRDYASVLRDVTEPNFAINPDFLAYTVALKDGRTLAGTVRTVGDKLLIGDQKGTVTEVQQRDVDVMAVQSISTMPEGLPKQIGPDRLRDLLTFLLTPAPQMPRDYPGERPKPRPRSEVHAALAGAPQPAEPTRPLRLVLVSGPKDHGPGEHDYPAWLPAWRELLSAADQVEVTTADIWPAADDFQKADVMVFYQKGNWDEKRAADIDAFLGRGGGLVYIHYAVDGGKESAGFAKRIGLAWPGNSPKFRHGPLELVFNRDTRHPVTRNFNKLALIDESYWNMQGSVPTDNVLATAVEESQPRPLFWTVQHPQGRVFVSIPGHYSWTFDDPLFRVLLLRGIAWSAKEPVDRFNDLVWPGAEVTD
ncbi:MAG: ThuA domain-containing protein [Planctomycetaceae bacterium]